MPRTYNVRLAALALGTGATWLDNLLSKHDLPGVSRSRQGVERRITEDGLLAIELCRMLNLEVGISLHRAVELTTLALPGEGDEFRHVTPGGLVITFSLPAVRVRLRERTLAAIETVATKPRGRPRTRRAAGGA